MTLRKGKTGIEMTALNGTANRNILSYSLLSPWSFNCCARYFVKLSISI